MAIAKLSIDLEARLAGLEQDLAKATQFSERAAKDIAQAFNVTRSSALGIGAALAGAFSATQLASFAKASIDSLDALNDLKDATGASIENISALEDVAARTGTSFESMSSTLVKFNKVLGDAKPKSQTANIIKQLGLDAEALKAADPAEALRQTAVALSKFADDGDKARIVQELFGKSVAEAAPFLKDLAEQTKLIGTVTAEQARAAEDFNKQLFALQKNAKDAGRALTSDLVSGINQLFEAIRGGAPGGESALNDWLAVPLQAASVLGANVSYVLKGVGNEIGGIAAQAVALAKLDYTQAKTIGETMRADAKLAREEFDKLERRLLSIGRELPVASYSNEGRTRTALPGVGSIADADKAKKQQSEFDKYIEKLEKAREAALNLSAVEQAYVDIYLGRLGKVSAEQEQLIIGMARETDERKKHAEQEKQFQAILASTPTGKLEEQRKVQVMLAQAFERGKFGALDSAAAVKLYGEAVAATLPEAAKEFAKEIEKLNEANREFAENVDALLGSGLENALSGNFKNISKDWERMLNQMAIRAAQQNLSKWLLGSDFKATGYVGGALGSAIGTGGSYPTTGVYDPGMDGYIVPSAGPQSARGGRMSGGTTVIYNSYYNVAAGVQRNELITALQTVSEANRADTQQQLRRAGVA